MVWVFSAIHFPATGTRFFLMLISRAFRLALCDTSTNIRKRAQTIPVSGLYCYGIEKKSIQKLPHSHKC